MGDTFSDEFQKQSEDQLADFDNHVDTYISKIPRNEEISELAAVVKDIYHRRILSGNSRMSERKQ